MSEPVHELVADPQPVVVPCVVGVNASQTLNLGEYNSVKIGVHLSVTVEPEDIEAAFTQVSEWVSDKMNQLYEEAVGGSSGKAGAA